MNEPKPPVRESDAAPDVRLAQIRARAEACELAYLSPLAEQVVKEDVPWLLDRLAVVEQERDVLLASLQDIIEWINKLVALADQDGPP